MEKSGSQKTLKVLSIIMIVFAALGILMSLLTLGGGALMGASSSVATTASDAKTAAGVGIIVAIAGFIMLISCCINLLVGIFGLRGANDPSKIGPFYVLIIIAMVLAVIGVIVNLAQGSDGTTIASSVIGLALDVWLFWLARNIKLQQQ